MIDILKELWLFLRVRKKLWMTPIIMVMILLGGLLVLAQGSVVAPFIYTLFWFDFSVMYILGISAFYHDSAACLLKDGQIIAAAQEERFTRKKHDSAFPSNAIKYCLLEAGVGAGEIASVVFYEKPFVKFERLLETYLAFARNDLAISQIDE